MVGNENIKVMIVDDTVTYRKILTKVIESID
ncbi:MAG: chemotaxis response regulator CheB, partial [bacterium]